MADTTILRRGSSEETVAALCSFHPTRPVVLWTLGNLFFAFNLETDEWEAWRRDVHSQPIRVLQFLGADCLIGDGRNLLFMNDRTFAASRLCMRQPIGSFSHCLVQEDSRSVVVVDKCGDVYSLDVTVDDLSEQESNSSELTIWFTHLATVTAMHSGEHYLFTGDREQKIRVGRRSPELYITEGYLMIHTAPVADIVEVSAEDGLVASCAQDRTVVLWSTLTKKPLDRLDVDAQPLQLSFLPDSKELVVLLEERDYLLLVIVETCRDRGSTGAKLRQPYRALELGGIPRCIAVAYHSAEQLASWKSTLPCCRDRSGYGIWWVDQRHRLHFPCGANGKRDHWVGQECE